MMCSEESFFSDFSVYAHMQNKYDPNGSVCADNPLFETYQITSAYQLWSFITRPSDVMVNIDQMLATETQLVILVFENVHQSCILYSRAVDIPQIFIFLKVLALFLKK